MSDTPPPPPAAGSFAAPPPPPPSFATDRDAAPVGAPPGTGGLRTAAIVLYWVTAGAMVLFAIALFSRKSVWDDFESGGDVTFDDLDAADGFVGGALLLTIGLALATTIVVSIWSLRVVRHAKQTGAVGVSPGLACGGWYIPLANAVVPFLQLKKAAEHFRRPTTFVTAWMALAIASLVLSLVLRIASGDGTYDFDEDVSGALTREVVIGVLLAAGTFVMAFVATRAMKQVEGR